jgi:hypothetical protein
MDDPGLRRRSMTDLGRWRSNLLLRRLGLLSLRLGMDNSRLRRRSRTDLRRWRSNVLLRPLGLLSLRLDRRGR